MLRSIFFSAGLFIALAGLLFFFVDKVVFNSRDEQIRQSGFRGLFMPARVSQPRVVDPPDWTSFSLISIGAVTMLYSVALPRKKPA
jgi:hypothetical protein